MRNASLVLLVAAGCGQGVATPPVTEQVALAPPAHGQQVVFGPFDVEAGQEVQLCRTLKLDNDQPIAVNRLEVQLAEGSHHFILFSSEKDFPDQTFPCWGTVNFDDWHFMMDVNRTGGYDWRLNDGQGFLLQPHQQIMLQSHYVNASTVQSPHGGLAYLNLHEIPVEQVSHPLKGMFTVNSRIAIPAHSFYESSRVCSFSRSVSIVAMTGHFHSRGRKFSVEKVGDDSLTSPGVPVYESDSWDSPLFKVFDPPLVVTGESLEGLRFKCGYFNDTDSTIGFGSHADVQEHCNLFFQYYDFDNVEQGNLACAQGSGGW